MSNTFRKVLAVNVLALGFSSAILASGQMPVAPATQTNSNYVFVALQGGFDWQHWNNYFNHDGAFSPAVSILTNAEVSKQGGFGGRASVGYGFNQFFSVEGGYSYLFTKPVVSLTNPLNGEVATLDIKTQIIDAFARIQAPVADNFSLYTKVGADYMINSAEGCSTKKFGPAFGVGAAYNFTPNWMLDASWTRYIGQIKVNDSWQPNIDFFALGLTYKFNF